MESLLDLPTITGLPTDPVSTAIAAQVTKPTATLKETALASFVPIEAHMRTLAARYKDVAYDVTTGKGMADAKAARLVLRDEGRYAVQRLVKRVKDEANDLKRVIDTRGDEVIAITKDIEASIDSQITSEEVRRAAAKAEAERIERERVAALEARLSGLSVWIDRCKVPDITAERIRKGIAMLEQAPIDDTWAEYKDRAIQRRADILGVMQGLYQERLIAEVEAQRLAEQRAEQARIQALLDERQRVLDAQAAELLRREEEIRAEEKAKADAAALDAAYDAMDGAYCRAWDRCGSERTYALRDAYIALDPAGKGVPRDKWVEYTKALDALDPEEVPAPAPTSPDYDALEGDLTDGPVYTGEPVDQTDAEIAAADGPEVEVSPSQAELIERGRQVVDDIIAAEVLRDAIVANEPATLKIGTICTRLGFTITAAFLHGKGVEPAGRDKAAVLYRESQWPAIKAALIRHIEAA